MDSDRTLIQKIVLWALLAMAVVFTVVNIVLKFLPGVAFEDTLLKVSEQDGKTVYTGKQYGDDITIVTYPEESGYVVPVTIGDAINHIYRVEYPGGTIKSEHGGEYDRITISRVRNGDVVKIIFDGGYRPGNWAFCKPDGSVDLGLGGIMVSSSSNPWDHFELSRHQVMSFVNGPETTTRGSWAHYGMALFLSIICAVAVAFPYTLFELRYHWSVKDPEPTDFYLRTNEIAGAVVAFVLLIVYIVGVTKIV